MEKTENSGRLDFFAYNPFENYELVEKIWIAMLDKCQHSYFMSWGWISTWIKSLPVENSLELIVGYQAGIPVLVFFVGRMKRIKFGLLPTNIISLNTIGDSYYDLLYVEYNSVLCESPTEQVVKEFFQYIDKLKWDEFILPGVTAGFIADFNIIDDTSRIKFHPLLEEVMSSFFVELQKIRDVDMDFLKLLSANRRSQVRRSIKQYELDGKVQITEAGELEQALTMFDELVRLHQDEWNKRGKPGVFSNKYIYQFHRDLISSRFDHNEIQLLQIRNDKMVIGLLYCFVYRNEVLFYQCGLSYTAGNVYRPGLVSHYYAIMHNAMKKMKTYDFLAGDEAYKSSLSTNSASMYWVSLMKNRVRLNIVKSLHGLKDNIKAMRFIENMKKSSVEAGSFHK